MIDRCFYCGLRIYEDETRVRVGHKLWAHEECGPLLKIAGAPRIEAGLFAAVQEEPETPAGLHPPLATRWRIIRRAMEVRSARA